MYISNWEMKSSLLGSQVKFMSHIVHVCYLNKMDKTGSSQQQNIKFNSWRVFYLKMRILLEISVSSLLHYTSGS